MTKRLSRRLNPKESLTLGLTFGQKVILSVQILEQPYVGTHESARSSPRNGFKQFPSALVLLAVPS